ncbi:hypothetical protein [uncultured Oxalicibacterium sp.]|uniref:hypothetical protein n=1 Tax=uncultured Oxalicibacterium sp. TaxID=1168540 RepID=UPI0025E74DB7|nr:hypothetical protein [uncultured Oxalicibacterium sp.]
MRKQLLALCAALLIAAPVIANDTVTGAAADVSQKGTVRAIKGKITGDETADYLIKVAAGQTLTVDLQTSNASSYFNITERDASEALFIGSVSGNTYEGVISAKGVYIVSVYLMRNAARRGEVADYTLNISVK